MHSRARWPHPVPQRLCKAKMSATRKELMVVGAGITGSLTAALLSRRAPEVAVSVTVWDKARGAGGRMTTYRQPTDPSLHVDMGAQYISHFKRTGESVEFQRLKDGIFSELTSEGILKPFCGQIEGELHDPAKQTLSKFVAPKGMSSIAKYFLSQSNAETEFQQKLTEIKHDSDHKIFCVTAHQHQAHFDAVVLTIPVPQMFALEGDLMSSINPEIVTKLNSVKYSSRYALGLFYDKGTNVPDCDWSGKYINNPVIRYASWDTAKRAAKEKILLLHTSVPFGIQHLESKTTEVQEPILQALNELIPGLPPASHSRLIHWRYSQVVQPYPGSPGCVVLSHKPLVVATGDGFSESSFEGCVYAADATVNALVQHL